MAQGCPQMCYEHGTLERVLSTLHVPSQISAPCATRCIEAALLRDVEAGASASGRSHVALLRGQLRWATLEMARLGLVYGEDETVTAACPGGAVGTSVSPSPVGGPATTNPSGLTLPRQAG